MRGRDDVYEDWTVDLRDLTGRHCTEAESCRTVIKNKRLKYQISVCAWATSMCRRIVFLRIIYMYMTCVCDPRARCLRHLANNFLLCQKQRYYKVHQKSNIVNES